MTTRNLTSTEVCLNCHGNQFVAGAACIRCQAKGYVLTGTQEDLWTAQAEFESFEDLGWSLTSGGKPEAPCASCGREIVQGHCACTLGVINPGMFYDEPVAEEVSICPKCEEAILPGEPSEPFPMEGENYGGYILAHQKCQPETPGPKTEWVLGLASDGDPEWQEVTISEPDWTVASPYGLAGDEYGEPDEEDDRIVTLAGFDQLDEDEVLDEGKTQRLDQADIAPHLGAYGYHKLEAAPGGGTCAFCPDPVNFYDVSWHLTEGLFAHTECFHLVVAANGGFQNVGYLFYDGAWYHGEELKAEGLDLEEARSATQVYLASELLISGLEAQMGLLKRAYPFLTDEQFEQVMYRAFSILKEDWDDGVEYCRSIYRKA